MWDFNIKLVHKFQFLQPCHLTITVDVPKVDWILKQNSEKSENDTYDAHNYDLFS